jgi:hypothetical protein
MPRPLCDFFPALSTIPLHPRGVRWARAASNTARETARRRALPSTFQAETERVIPPLSPPSSVPLPQTGSLPVGSRLGDCHRARKVLHVRTAGRYCLVLTAPDFCSEICALTGFLVRAHSPKIGPLYSRSTALIAQLCCSCPAICADDMHAYSTCLADIHTGCGVFFYKHETPNPFY